MEEENLIQWDVCLNALLWPIRLNRKTRIIALLKGKVKVNEDKCAICSALKY